MLCPSTVRSTVVGRELTQGVKYCTYRDICDVIPWNFR